MASDMVKDVLNPIGKPNKMETNIGAVKAGPAKKFDTKVNMTGVKWSGASYSQPDRPAKKEKVHNPYAGKGRF